MLSIYTKRISIVKKKTKSISEIRKSGKTERKGRDVLTEEEEEEKESRRRVERNALTRRKARTRKAAEERAGDLRKGLQIESAT